MPAFHPPSGPASLPTSIPLSPATPNQSLPADVTSTARASLRNDPTTPVGHDHGPQGTREVSSPQLQRALLLSGNTSAILSRQTSRATARPSLCPGSGPSCSDR